MGGKLTRCLLCLRADVEIERQQREAIAARAQIQAEAKTVAPPATKVCRSCRIAKPLEQFSRHRLAKDGHRHDCCRCVKQGLLEVTSGRIPKAKRRPA